MRILVIEDERKVAGFVTRTGAQKEWTIPKGERRSEE